MGRVLESEVLGDLLGPHVGDELAAGGAHLQIGQPRLGGNSPARTHVIAQTLRSPVNEFRQDSDAISRLRGQWFPIRDSIQITFHAEMCLGFSVNEDNTRAAGPIFQKIEIQLIQLDLFEHLTASHRT